MVLTQHRGANAMTDKRIKQDCPFCHEAADKIQVSVTKGKVAYGHIFCPHCGCMFVGKSKQELIDRWNMR